MTTKQTLPILEVVMAIRTHTTMVLVKIPNRVTVDKALFFYSLMVLGMGVWTPLCQLVLWQRRLLICVFTYFESYSK